MLNFDKKWKEAEDEFKASDKRFKIGMTIAICAGVLCTIGWVITVVQIGKQIQQKGLKSIVGCVWNGEQGAPK